MNLENELKMSYYRVLTDLNENHRVKLVQHVETGRLYVLKTLSVYDRMVFDYLVRHPAKGTPKIVEIMEADGKLTVVEEYIAGESLQYIMRKRGLFSETEAVRILDQLCDILRPLHSHQPPIVHRDIKPSNLIVTPEGALVLVDFNAAKKSDNNKNQDTVLIGTVGYAAPEQYGFAASRPTADIYAIGVLLNEMLTGHPPGQATYPGRLSAVINKCIQMDPSQRYQNVDALQRAIHRGTSPGTTGGVRGWLPPGLGSKKAWVFILSALWYLFFISISLAWNKEDATPKELVVNRVMCLIMFLAMTLFIGNYRNVWDAFSLTRSKHILVRICGLIVGTVLIFLAVVIMIAILV